MKWHISVSALTNVAVSDLCFSFAPAEAGLIGRSYSKKQKWDISVLLSSPPAEAGFSNMCFSFSPAEADLIVKSKSEISQFC